MQVAAASHQHQALQGNQPAAAPSFALGLSKAHLWQARGTMKFKSTEGIRSLCLASWLMHAAKFHPYVELSNFHLNNHPSQSCDLKTSRSYSQPSAGSSAMLSTSQAQKVRALGFPYPKSPESSVPIILFKYEFQQALQLPFWGYMCQNNYTVVPQQR